MKSNVMGYNVANREMTKIEQKNNKERKEKIWKKNSSRCSLSKPT